MANYYEGQIFEGVYPEDAAEFCNENGYCINEITEETDTERRFEIKAVEEPTEEEQRKMLDMLSLTAADVERAIYKVKGMDFDDIIELVEASDTGIDTKALKIELKANNFYRGNEYISTVGALLGFTSDRLDEFFKTNDYTKLIENEDGE